MIIVGSQTPKHIDVLKHRGVKVSVPATISNLGCGINILGIALKGLADEVIAKFGLEPCLKVTSISGTKDSFVLDASINSASRSALALLRSLNKEDVGIEMQIKKKVPVGVGLGSMAATAVASVMAVNELMGRPYEKRDLLSFALEGCSNDEGKNAHKVVASLLGGCMLLRDADQSDFVRIPVPRGFFIAAIYPVVGNDNRLGRPVLKSMMTLADYSHHSANLGSFIMGMVKADYDMIKRSMSDSVWVSQLYSCNAMFNETKSIAMKAGALGCSYTGNGPAVFAVFDNSLYAEEFVAKALELYRSNKVEAVVVVSGIDNEGAILL